MRSDPKLETSPASLPQAVALAAAQETLGRAPLTVDAPNAASDFEAVIRRGLGNLSRLQADRGSWPGDYGGPMFLLPMYVALCQATNRMPTGARRDGLITYFSNVQRSDGSIGLHAEATSGSMLTTVLSYVSMRALGLGPDDSRLVRMRGSRRGHGAQYRALGCRDKTRSNVSRSP